MMGALQDYAQRLLELGSSSAHPASAVIGVSSQGVSATAASGWALLPTADEPGVLMSDDTLVDCASVTKVVATTVIVMRLVSLGRLRLLDHVADYLPEFETASKRGVRIVDLLTHTSGMPAWLPLYCFTSSREEALQEAQRVSLESEPGSRWSYSDLGMIVLGALIEKIEGERLDVVYHHHVSGPLALRSGFGPQPAMNSAASADSDAYEYRMIASGSPYPVPFTPDVFGGWRNRTLRGEVNDGNAAHALGAVSGHAGLFSTVGDLLTLGRALIGGDFVDPSVMDLFSRPSEVNPAQAVGFRSARVHMGDTVLPILYHPGFTGTWFGMSQSGNLVVAGAAMRLYGVVGCLPSKEGPQPVPRIVSNDDIQAVLCDAAAGVTVRWPNKSNHAESGH